MKKNTKQRFKRKYEIQDEHRIIYIFTEGEETEPNYFESKKREIRNTNIKIKIKGTGYNTTSLVDYVEDFLVKNNIKIGNSDNSDNYWVVFDRDDFSSNFDSAVEKAEKLGLKVAYSNECFELWFLLHFNFIDTAIGRKELIKKLDKEISKTNGQSYQKNSKNMYEIIKNMEKDAIKNAEKLLEMYKKEHSYLKKDPSTTVHLLVNDLNALNK
ncbi:MAG: abortive phage infection protein [Candidatus Moranbacteria bacterium CG23_combo_of_CG06-09_8_20_14_all_39_10]|nr:MAG: abortive phage infection protein [Candidatus Moranbacteria bacterium CG23_combo_of_CG06-09_8_20_14_all_39_10]